MLLYGIIISVKTIKKVAISMFFSYVIAEVLYVQDVLNQDGSKLLGHSTCSFEGREQIGGGGGGAGFLLAPTGSTQTWIHRFGKWIAG